MKINTYAVNCNDAWLNTDGDDISDSYVKYKDHQAVVAELEAKCAAMAAENAGLKAAHPQPFGPEMMKALDAYEKHQDDVPETGMLDAFFILRDSIRVDATATDAFLAEVRAQGVEMFADSMQIAGGGEHPYSAVAKKFAAKLRKGASA
ncbi:hypothetical protein EYX56_04980 [Escherichia coli]|nr:hypothetical protein [Escherichia coli]